MNLDVLSMSPEATWVWNSCLAIWKEELLQESCLIGTSSLLRREADTGQIRPLLQEQIRMGEVSSAFVV